MKTEKLCKFCHSSYLVENKQLNRGKGLFCSNVCSSFYQHSTNNTRAVVTQCHTCCKQFVKRKSQIAKTKNNFCSKHCSATWNNKHKTYGFRKSKFEIWLANKLGIYDFEIHFNRKDAINSELDIYIPSLKLAFEINGISHYKPIYGLEKFSQIQTNDKSKIEACLSLSIELHILDIKDMKKFNESEAIKFHEQVTNLISEHLAKSI